MVKYVHIIIRSICISILAFVSIYHVLWWDAGSWGSVTGWPHEGGPTLESRFATWDGAHYLHIASKGYSSESGSCAFYPLWPGLIRLGSLVTGGNVFWSGIILSNLFSLAALVLFYGFVRDQHGPRAANWALALMLAFPSAIFFNLIYTESLFLLLVVGFFRFLFRNQFFWAGVCAFFLPLTKAVGIFVLPVFFFQLWRERRPVWDYLTLLFPGLGYLAYFAVMWFFTGNPVAGFAAQKLYPNQPSIDNLLNIGQAIRGLLNVNDFHGGMHSAVDRFHFLVVVQALVLVWLLDKRYFAYAVFVGGIPAFTHIYWSYPRLMMMAFPVFIALAVYLQDRLGKWILWYLITIMAALQLYFIALYVNFKWAS